METLVKNVTKFHSQSDKLSCFFPRGMDVPDSSLAALELAIAKFGVDGLGGLLGKSHRSIQRYRNGESEIKPWLIAAIKGLLVTQAPSNHSFTFIDLFAGIGGLRLGFDRAGGKCVFTSEWNKYSQETYRKNFPDDDHVIEGDITKILPADVPSHDVLLAGFPCQPFSLAGVSKKNSLGREHGFKDKTQGTLFFDICQIIQAKQPKAFLLENVKNLISHNSGETFATIRGALEKELGYEIAFKVIDGRCYVPQHRERIYIVGYRKDLKTKFSFDCLKLPKQGPVLNSILHRADEEPESPFTVRKRTLTSVASKYTLTDNLWNYLQAYADKHAAAGNGFGYSTVGPGDVARTLSARYHKDGSEILIKQPGRNPRRLTPRECARLMGFDRPGQPLFKIPVSDTQAYRQFGNSVIVPVVEQVALLMAAYLRGEKPEPVQPSTEEPELQLALA